MSFRGFWIYTFVLDTPVLRRLMAFIKPDGSAWGAPTNLKHSLTKRTNGPAVYLFAVRAGWQSVASRQVT